MNQLYLTCIGLLIGVQGCAPSARQPAPSTTLEHSPARPHAIGAYADVDIVRMMDMTRRFEAYVLHDAAWVTGQPLLVNTEFDFAMAMIGHGAGAGIAAQKRQARGLEIAKELRRVEADPRWADKLRNHASAAPRERIALYGLLFGDSSARLLTSVEWAAQHAQPDEWSLRFVDVSDPRPFHGANSWTSNSGAHVSNTMERSLERIGSIRDLVLQRPTPGTAPLVCRAAAGLTLEGLHIAQTDARVLIASSEQPKTYIACPHDIASSKQ